MKTASSAVATAALAPDQSLKKVEPEFLALNFPLPESTIKTWLDLISRSLPFRPIKLVVPPKLQNGLI